MAGAAPENPGDSPEDQEEHTQGGRRRPHLPVPAGALDLRELVSPADGGISQPRVRSLSRIAHQVRSTALSPDRPDLPR